MSWKEITVQPAPDVSHYDTVVELDGQRYRLSFYTNRVDDAWQLDINGVVFGIGLATGVDLLYPYRYFGDSLIPPGPLWIEDKGLGGRDPDLLAFTEGRCALYYLEVG